MQRRGEQDVCGVLWLTVDSVSLPLCVLSFLIWPGQMWDIVSACRMPGQEWKLQDSPAEFRTSGHPGSSYSLFLYAVCSAAAPHTVLTWLLQISACFHVDNKASGNHVMFISKRSVLKKQYSRVDMASKTWKTADLVLLALLYKKTRFYTLNSR